MKLVLSLVFVEDVFCESPEIFPEENTDNEEEDTGNGEWFVLLIFAGFMSYTRSRANRLQSVFVKDHLIVLILIWLPSSTCTILWKFMFF